VTVNPDLFRASSDPETWKLLAAAINGEFAMIDMDAARRKPAEGLSEREAEAEREKTIAPARQLMTQMINYRWGGYRQHYTVGQLDTNVLVLMAEKNVIGWQDLFNAKAAFGTAEDLVAVQQRALLFGATVNPSHALPHAAKPLLLVNGLRHDGNLATTEQLFKMGADPGYDNNGGLFSAVVEAGRADIGRVFAKYGQHGLLNIDAWVTSAKNNRKLKLYEDLRKIQWEYGRFTVIDNETLAENKPLPDNTGNLKIIFNFASHRVTEIMEITNPKQAIVKDFSFDDYGQNAITAAREKLVELGASPSKGESLLGKPSVARPAIRGLGS